MVITARCCSCLSITKTTTTTTKTMIIMITSINEEQFHDIINRFFFLFSMTILFGYLRIHLLFFFVFLISKGILSSSRLRLFRIDENYLLHMAYIAHVFSNTFPFYNQLNYDMEPFICNLR
jgi:hypothetical protein